MFKTKEENKVIISLTGYRPSKLAGYDLSIDYYNRFRQRLVRIIERALAAYDTVECHSGMALGADTVWAQAVVHCKTKYGERIQFVADIPDVNQPSKWLKESQQEWHHLIAHADVVKTYANDLNRHRSYGYILNERNIGMIQACDILIAIYDGKSPGGTANGVRDGKRLNKWITHIDPKTI